jgi:hypothetical protein
MWNHNGYYGYYKNRKKGKHFNILEKYHLFGINKDNLHTNDTFTDIYCHTFDTLKELYARWQHIQTRHVIKAGLVTLNAHNIYTHKPLNNVTTQAVLKTVQPMVNT